MPELPDILTYIRALQARIMGHELLRVHIRSPFLVRTFDPPMSAIEGTQVRAIRRLGKRVVLELAARLDVSAQAPPAPPLFLILHLMIAGRLRWDDCLTGASTRRRSRARPTPAPAKIVQALFEFTSGRLTLTEAGTKKRAALHLVRGEAELARLDPGGLDVLTADAASFAARLRQENHTLKRALTDPRLLDGIGNAYSDEVLHAARLSPLALTHKLTDDEISRLHAATCATLTYWIDALQTEFAERFPAPSEITAFRPQFAVHGKFGQPCPDCGAPIQRIRYAENETNYCARCQTAGRLLADRSLSRLLRDDWPRRIEDLEST